VIDSLPDDPEGCYYLAQLYAAGRGVTMDVDSAANLNRRACDFGYRAACPKRRES
jgi:TPR repeat protein